MCSGGGCTLSAIGGWRGGGGVDALGGGLGHGRVAPRGVRATAATLLVGRARGRSGGRVVAVFVLHCVDVRAGWLYRCDSLFSFLDACRSVTRFHTPAPARTPDVATNTHSFEHRPHALLKAPPAPPMYTSPAGSTLLPYTRAHHKRPPPLPNFLLAKNASALAVPTLTIVGHPSRSFSSITHAAQ